MIPTIESLGRQHQEVLAQLDAVEAALSAPESGAALTATWRQRSYTTLPLRSRPCSPCWRGI
jgi:hypothetical protein